MKNLSRKLSIISLYLAATMVVFQNTYGSESRVNAARICMDLDVSRYEISVDLINNLCHLSDSLDIDNALNQLEGVRDILDQEKSRINECIHEHGRTIMNDERLNNDFVSYESSLASFHGYISVFLEGEYEVSLSNYEQEHAMKFINKILYGEEEELYEVDLCNEF